MRQTAIVAKLLLHAALLALLVVWVVEPAGHSRLFRQVALGLFVTPVVGLLLPWTRAAMQALLDRVLPVLDVFAINVVLIVGLAEATTRLVAHGSDSPLLVSPNAKAQERIRAWRGRPGAQGNGRRFNAQGFFDEDFETERRPGVRRVVALGDSFAVGVVPYAENFLTRLDGLLDRTAPTEVYNLGIVSIGPEDYLHLYRTEGRRLEPDLVLLCLFVGNDVRPIRAASLLHRESLLVFSFLRRAWLAQGRGPALEGTTPADRAPTFSEEEFLAIERSRLGVAERSPRGREARAWRDTLAQLEETAAEIGPRLRVVIIPDEFQVNEALLTRLLAEREGRDLPALEIERPQRVLGEFFEARGVPVLDLLPALRAAERDGPTYKPRDTHWNVRGNRVAAREIAAWLEP